MKDNNKYILNLSYLRATHTGTPPDVEHRPLCPNCHKPLKVSYGKDFSEWVPGRGGIKEDGTWRYKSYDYFCTLRCGTDYANKIIESKIKKS